MVWLSAEESVRYLEERARKEKWIHFGTKGAAGEIREVERFDYKENELYVRMKIEGRTDDWTHEDLEEVLRKVLRPILKSKKQTPTLNIIPVNFFKWVRIGRSLEWFAAGAGRVGEDGEGSPSPTPVQSTFHFPRLPCVLPVRIS